MHVFALYKYFKLLLLLLLLVTYYWGCYPGLSDGVYFFPCLHRQEYVSDLFHYLHNSGDSPQLLASLESFLISVIRDVKHYSSETERLEEALKRFAG